MRHLARLLMISFSLLLALGGLELLLRRAPGLTPLPVFYQLPGGGRYLQPLVFDEPPIATGFRYRPMTDLPFTFNPDDPSILGGQAGRIEPPSEQRVLQLRLVTDEEGFVNPPPAAGEPFDIVVTGDSFLGLSSSLHWLDLLAEQTGMRVRNLGMPGWGPQAQAEALARFGAANQPDWMLMAFFEGNDLWDAMVYEQHRASGLRWDEHDLSGTSFAERLVLPAFLEWQLQRMGEAGVFGEPDIVPAVYPLDVQVGERWLELVFADLYVRRLGARRADIEASRNWALTREAILRARDTAEAAGARFALVTIPSEPRVYLPSLPPTSAVLDAIGVVQEEGLGPEGWLGPLGDAAMTRERLTASMDDQAAVLAGLAEAEGIAHIDLGPAFRETAAGGVLLYNHVDTHWNDAGQALAARTVAEALVKTAPTE